MKIFLLSLILLPSLSFAVDCPVKEGESQLTLPRIMKNFRDFLETVDRTAKEGAQNPASITDETLTAAIANLDVVLACSAKALEKNESVYPESYFDLEGEARDKYMVEFYEYMNRFDVALDQYQTMFKTLLATPADQRNFKDLSNHALEVRDLANEAHHHL